uniref:Solute carrier family 10 member 1 n=1 Tax=Paramormyrops kingsleyae TaxID=1676925 RepID=A0A3B3SUI8_9TELE
MNEILNETLGLYSSTVPSNFSLLSPAFANSTTTLQLPHSVALDKAINIVTIIILFITMVSLGCTMEIPKIKAYMMKPREVLLAVLTQYGIMPLTAFLMAKVFQLSPLEAVTVLICGCSPGGNLSNILAWAFQGDMNLSIVMTTCSTALALGMMPLLLYLYCKGIPDIQNAVPFMGIFIALLMTLLPCAIGIAINHRFPRFSHIITKMQKNSFYGNWLSEYPALCHHPEGCFSPRDHWPSLPLPVTLQLLSGWRASAVCCPPQVSPEIFCPSGGCEARRETRVPVCGQTGGDGTIDLMGDAWTCQSGFQEAHLILKFASVHYLP